MNHATVLADGFSHAHATGALSGIWLLVAIPLASATVLLLLGKKADKWGHWLGVLAVAASFVLGLVFFIQLGGLDAEHRSAELSMWDFIAVGNLHVDFGMLFDPLSGIFVLLITGVGSLIHLYAVGYMEHDPGRRKFFAYFNLFVAAMLLLVLGNNYVMLYFGWEGVGLASYLLISFWYTRPSAATAGKKAFLMNRVGDDGLAIGIFLMFTTLGSTAYAAVFHGASRLTATTVLVLGLLLLLGACGKSGQFPLQAWLPDAMEGPTPVSALIHAATMVTAGVYLVARMNPLYDLTETGQVAVAIIGTITLLIGAIIGCAYDDIKKVLAYSTVSQIGYMFLAVGLGPFGYALGIAHLLAHGFFKAGLFLGAGSVMHAMNDNVDMRHYGGLARVMPITFVTFGLGYLALIGFPFLSGYFTKDAIIEAAFAAPGWQGWTFGLIATIAAGLTAFYMTRLMFMTFFGEKRWKDLTSEDGKAYHPHESPSLMTVPMVLVAVGSVFAGFYLTNGHRLANWLTPSLGELEERTGPLPAAAISTLVLVCAAIGVLIAWLAVGRHPTPVERPRHVSWPVQAARRDLYANAINETLIATPGTWLARFLVYVDNRGVDGVVNGTAALLGGSSGRLRRLQTGFVRSYALTMLGGAVLVVAALLVVGIA